MTGGAEGRYGEEEEGARMGWGTAVVDVGGGGKGGKGRD